MNSLSSLLASIQSIGQQLDHLALTNLSDEAKSRYLTQCNLHQLQLSHKTQLDWLAKEEVLSAPKSFEENSSDDNEEQSSEESIDLAETQIMTRKPLQQSSNLTIQSLTDALDKDLKRTDIWLQRGKLWQEQEDYAAALSDFLHAYRLSPTNKLVLKAIAELRAICAHQGKPITLDSILL